MPDQLRDAVERCKRGETREQQLMRLVKECGERKQREFLEETQAWTKELVEIEMRKPMLPIFISRNYMNGYFEDAPSDVSGAVK